MLLDIRGLPSLAELMLLATIFKQTLSASRWCLQRLPEATDLSTLALFL
jgi:hypothetical protein